MLFVKERLGGTVSNVYNIPGARILVGLLLRDEKNGEKTVGTHTHTYTAQV